MQLQQLGRRTSKGLEIGGALLFLRPSRPWKPLARALSVFDGRVCRREVSSFGRSERPKTLLNSKSLTPSRRDVRRSKNRMPASRPPADFWYNS